MEKSFNSKTPKLVGGTVLSAITLIGIYVFVLQGSNNQESNLGTSATNVVNATATPTSSTSETTTASSNAAAYRDGTYSATASYSVPHNGSNKITVKLTLANGAISDLSVDNSYADGESAQFISNFSSKIKANVVGKSISSLSVSRIGGASLTTLAFMNALSTIKNDAA